MKEKLIRYEVIMKYNLIREIVSTRRDAEAPDAP
jgi:hypothetical protein